MDEETLPNASEDCIEVEVESCSDEAAKTTMPAQCFIDTGSRGDGVMDLMTKKFAQLLMNSGIGKTRAVEDKYIGSPVGRETLKCLGHMHVVLTCHKRESRSYLRKEVVFAIYDMPPETVWDVLIGRKTLFETDNFAEVFVDTTRRSLKKKTTKEGDTTVSSIDEVALLQSITIEDEQEEEVDEAKLAACK
jgi:hypothetical protein